MLPRHGRAPTRYRVEDGAAGAPRVGAASQREHAAAGRVDAQLSRADVGDVLPEGPAPHACVAHVNGGATVAGDDTRTIAEPACKRGRHERVRTQVFHNALMEYRIRNAALEPPPHDAARRDSHAAVAAAVDHRHRDHEPESRDGVMWQDHECVRRAEHNAGGAAVSARARISCPHGRANTRIALPRRPTGS